MVLTRAALAGLCCLFLFGFFFPRAYREQCKTGGHNGDRGHCLCQELGDTWDPQEHKVCKCSTDSTAIHLLQHCSNKINLVGIKGPNTDYPKSAVGERAVNSRGCQGEPVLCPGERENPAMLNHNHPAIPQPHQSTASTLKFRGQQSPCHWMEAAECLWDLKCCQILVGEGQMSERWSRTLGKIKKWFFTSHFYIAVTAGRKWLNKWGEQRTQNSDLDLPRRAWSGTFIPLLTRTLHLSMSSQVPEATCQKGTPPPARVVTNTALATAWWVLGKGERAGWHWMWMPALS